VPCEQHRGVRKYLEDALAEDGSVWKTHIIYQAHTMFRHKHHAPEKITLEKSGKNVELVRLHFDEVQFEDNRHAKGCLRVICLLFGGISEN
jgi:hypothetical protein